MGKWSTWSVPLGVVVLVGGLYGKAQCDDAEAASRARRVKDEAEQTGVKVSARFDDDCPNDHPIAVTVANTTQRTLKSVGYHLAIYESGSSEDLNGLTGADRWSYVVGPGAEETKCYDAPPLRHARYFIRVSRDPDDVYMRAIFYQDGDFIPRAADPAPSPSARASSPPPPRGARPASSHRPSPPQ